MTALDPRLVRAVAIGTERCGVFADYEDGRGTFSIEDVPVYAKPPVDLREVRREHGLYLGDAARRLNIRAFEMAGLERGEYAPADGDWPWIVAGIVAGDK